MERPQAFPALLRSRGRSSDALDWIVEPLRKQGYAFLELSSHEKSIVDALFRQSRSFFARTNPEKEAFKLYPTPGGYLTPFPGTYELFEFRRGLSKCPPELAAEGMAAFMLFEALALSVTKAIERFAQIELAAVCSDRACTMRCIHYDRPLESVGDADVGAAPSAPLPVGSNVRVTSMAALSGASGKVAIASTQEATVELCGLPSAVAAVYGPRVSMSWEHTRKIERNVPGMYPAHTDSSLVTIAPRSTIAGLEAKDLHTGAWFPIEELMLPSECLVFVGDPLDYATAHRIPALMHRPSVCRGEPPATGASASDHRIATPFFLYPRESAFVSPADLPRISFKALNSNIKQCRDHFPWKRRCSYYSDLTYSTVEAHEVQ